ncbi:MAG TPA: fumarylacetoacetase [Gemmatimonadales bacterium]|nr:fumarylacetoacetase [Gemmatimonadales bacterium]
MNRTHDPSLRSWVDSAQGPTDFPIQNLPFGIFRKRDSNAAPVVGVAIGDRILDVRAAHSLAHFSGAAGVAADACDSPSLNGLMSLNREHWTALRVQVSSFLAVDSPTVRSGRAAAERTLVSMSDAELFLPAQIGDYSDFYASVYHATNVGSMFRPDNPLLPNYKWVPIGYHGRASSVVVSGTAVRRPQGQLKDPQAAAPVFSPSRALDYEMELGCFVGTGNRLGEPVPIRHAENHLFGVCLVNDWSARDIQSWEYQPLGPFLAKSFATSVSPWVVTLDALEPFRTSRFERAAGDPAPLPYLDSGEDRSRGGLDIKVEVYLSSVRMRKAGIEPTRLSRGSAAELYWTLGQMFTHHTSNGCNLRPGDLFATGTISGQSPDSRGCLLELTWRGRDPITLPNGEVRRFLEDGDEVIMRASCERPGATRIGFGECRGVVQGAER